MKKLLFLLAALMSCSFGYTQDLGVSWLETGQSKLDCKKIHLRHNNARIVLANGEKMAIPINLIHSYSLNGRQYTQLPLYNNDGPTSLTLFMELVKTYGEFGLYKFEEKDLRPINQYHKKVRYFLYKGNKLNLDFDDKMLPDMNFAFDLTSIPHH
jgi:hypothetical protein